MNKNELSLRFDIPIYDSAMNDFFQIVISGFFDSDPLLSNIERKPVDHKGPTRNIRGEIPLDQDMPMISGESLISTISIENTDFDEITMFFHYVVKEMRDRLAREFFRSIDEITEATGKSFDFKGKPLSLDHLNKLLENMPIPFDDQGEPILPTFIVSPEMEEHIKSFKGTKEQIKRYNEIIEEKRVEFYAKKRDRRLS